MRWCIVLAVFVSANGCDIVFRLDDLRPNTDASDEDELDAPERNIEDYVIARYELDETSGNVAVDSGPPPALNLTIDNPANIAWRSGGLDILQEVRLSSGTGATKITDACIASNEVSIEVWATPNNTTPV